MIFKNGGGLRYKIESNLYIKRPTLEINSTYIFMIEKNKQKIKEKKKFERKSNFLKNWFCIFYYKIRKWITVDTLNFHQMFVLLFSIYKITLIIFSYDFLEISIKIYSPYQNSWKLNTRFHKSYSHAYIQSLKIYRHNIFLNSFEVNILTTFIKITKNYKLFCS